MTAKLVKCKHPKLDKTLRCKTCGVLVDIRGKKNKYGARRTEAGGHKFHSLKEARRYVDLSNNPLVSEIECQKEYSLEVNGHLICKYRADFDYSLRGRTHLQRVVEDVKPRGKAFRNTAAYRLFIIKKNLMCAIHNIEVLEV
jgi:hypothetical protein